MHNKIFGASFVFVDEGDNNLTLVKARVINLNYGQSSAN